MSASPQQPLFRAGDLVERPDGQIGTVAYDQQPGEQVTVSIASGWSRSVDVHYDPADLQPA